jgi:hypothetical protein
MNGEVNWIRRMTPRILMSSVIAERTCGSFVEFGVRLLGLPGPSLQLADFGKAVANVTLPVSPNCKYSIEAYSASGCMYDPFVPSLHCIGNQIYPCIPDSKADCGSTATFKASNHALFNTRHRVTNQSAEVEYGAQPPCQPNTRSASP